MSNFIKMVFATLKEEGVDTQGMSTGEAIKKYEEMQAKGIEKYKEELEQLKRNVRSAGGIGIKEYKAFREKYPNLSMEEIGLYTKRMRGSLPIQHTEQDVHNFIKEEEIYNERRKREEADEIEALREREKEMSATAKTLGVTYEQLDKERRGLRKYERYQEELSYINLRQYESSTGGGYVGNKSVRAIRAEKEGKFSASMAAEFLGTTPAKIKKYLTPTEWHHSSGTMMKAVDYYDIEKLMEVAGYNIDLEDYKNDKEYKEAVDTLYDLRGVKNPYKN